MRIYLDLSLLPTCGLKVAFPNPLGNFGPQLPALPLVLHIERTYADLLFVTSHVRKRSACLDVLARRVPLPLERVHRVVRPRRRDNRLERVRLAREVTLAFVLDLDRESACLNKMKVQAKTTHGRQPSSRALNVRVLRQLNIRRSVPQAIYPQSR